MMAMLLWPETFLEYELQEKRIRLGSQEVDCSGLVIYFFSQKAFTCPFCYKIPYPGHAQV